ncbi:Mariner Mos1 transposase [Eumeta japonica]|uniref:Mariner Mos1 transposase n=1 Tax=Eumeta variegata TaxID=151549 RepID=A0A4C1VTS0_EUMVA|nr:Mariner Mos1 transposase [Eumeta japonica]
MVAHDRSSLDRRSTKGEVVSRYDLCYVVAILETFVSSSGRIYKLCNLPIKYFNLWIPQKRKGFLHRIVTGDEKWIHYDNPKRRKSWGKPGHASTSSAKPNIHGSKLLLCIWWDQQGVIYYELLKPNETIMRDPYVFQLMRLSRSLKEKRPLFKQSHGKVVFLHDNTLLHVAKPVKTYLEMLQWEVLLHPAFHLT